VARGQVAEPRLDQAVKAVAEKAGGEQGQQPGAIGRAGHRAQDGVQPFHLSRAGQHRSPDQKNADQDENHSPGGGVECAQNPDDDGQHRGHVAGGKPLPEIEPDRPPRRLQPGHYDQAPGYYQQHLPPARAQQLGRHARVLPLLGPCRLPRRSSRQQPCRRHAEHRIHHESP
jgi:hypothetical protein